MSFTSSSSPANVPSRPARRGWLMVVVLLLAAGGGGYAWSLWGNGVDKTPQYVFATVQRTDFEDLVSATGTLQPRDYVDVGAQVSGQLEKLHVDIGDEVKKGQLLAEIDAEQTVARIDASRANQRAQHAQLAQKQVNLQKAERDLARLQRLWQEGATTEEQVQNAETAVASERAGISAQKAQIEQSQASMRVEEATLKYTKIYAPMAGTVVSLNAKQGQTLNANQTAPVILRIADLSTMTVKTEVSEADVPKIKKGMPVYFTTLGSQGRRWTGRLQKIEPTPTVTNNVVLYNALFDVDNSGRNLLPSMTAQVFFIVAQAKDALVLPPAAVTYQRLPGGMGMGQEGSGSEADQEARRAMRERMRAERQAAGGGAQGPGGGEGRQRPEGMQSRPSQGGGDRQGMPRPATVKVVTADGSIIERDITVGVSSRAQVQILSGLEEGEKVVAGIRPVDPRQQKTANRQAQGPMGMSPQGAPGRGLR